jgi:hypothetical protein
LEGYLPQLIISDRLISRSDAQAVVAEHREALDRLILTTQVQVANALLVEAAREGLSLRSQNHLVSCSSGHVDGWWGELLAVLALVGNEKAKALLSRKSATGLIAMVDAKTLLGWPGEKYCPVTLLGKDSSLPIYLTAAMLVKKGKLKESDFLTLLAEGKGPLGTRSFNKGIKEGVVRLLEITSQLPEQENKTEALAALLGGKFVNTHSNPALRWVGREANPQLLSIRTKTFLLKADAEVLGATWGIKYVTGDIPDAFDTLMEAWLNPGHKSEKLDLSLFENDSGRLLRFLNKEYPKLDSKQQKLLLLTFPEEVMTWPFHREYCFDKRNSDLEHAFAELMLENYKDADPGVFAILSSLEGVGTLSERVGLTLGITQQVGH